VFPVEFKESFLGGLVVALVLLIVLLSDLHQFVNLRIKLELLTQHLEFSLVQLLYLSVVVSTHLLVLLLEK
jgi:hypothetical protein